MYEAGKGGAYRTENFAARWERAGGPAGDELVQMATAPDDPKRLYAAGYHGLFESRDGGQHWMARKMPGEGSPVVALMPLAGGVLLAGTASGAYRAVDGGAWTEVMGQGITALQGIAEVGKRNYGAHDNRGTGKRGPGDDMETVRRHESTGLLVRTGLRRGERGARAR